MTEHTVSMTDLVPEAIRDTRSLIFAAQLDRFAGLPGAANRVMEIDQVTVSALPALFNHFGIAALWDYVPTDPARRALIKEALTLHARRGTLSGFGRLAELAGAEVVRADSAPAKVFCGASLTPTEREAMMAAHPALQIFPFNDAGVANGFYGVKGANSRRFELIRSQRFSTLSTAACRFGGQVSLTDPDTGLTQRIDRVAGDSLRQLTIRLPGKAQGRFCGGFAGCLVNQGAAQRYFALDLDRPYGSDAERWQTLSLQPSMMPMTGRFEPISISSIAQGNYGGRSHGYTGAAQHRLFTMCSTAYRRFGRELRLFDPHRAHAARRRLSTLFANGARLSRLKPYHGVLALDLHRRAHAPQAFCGGYLARRFGVPSTARAAIDAVRVALRWSARLADRIQLSTAPYRAVRVSPVVRVGAVRAGEFRREVL